MVDFNPAEVIRKMCYNLKMHSKHSSYCPEEIEIDLFLGNAPG